MAVPGMGGVERPAQQPDARRRGFAEAKRAKVQGRTWPLPRTMYL
jgi:hypothetical protein